MDNQTPPLETWQEEEVSVPHLSFDMDFDQHGQPTNIRPKMVEEKIKRRYMHTALIPHTICAPSDHYFEVRNQGKRVNGRLEVQCHACSYGRAFVVGHNRLEDGKILTLGIDF